MKLHNLYKSLSDLLSSPKDRGEDNVRFSNRYVAAGDPAKSVALLNEIIFDPSDSQLIVAGDSMAPQGIVNGDKVTYRPIDSSKIKRGDYIVVKVDQDFYTHRKTPCKFNVKLRCAICPVPGGLDFEEFYKEVRFIEDSVLLPRKKEELANKYKEAQDYYGIKEALLLSVTYKDGKIHYSFHPLDLVQGKIEKVERRLPNGQWDEVKSKELL